MYSKTNERKELPKLQVQSGQKHDVLPEFWDDFNFNFLTKVLLVSVSHHLSLLRTFKACSTYKYTSLQDKEAELLNKTM